MTLKHIKRAISKLSQATVTNILMMTNSRASGEAFEGKSKIAVFVIWALNWWLVILNEIAEEQAVWRIWHRDVWRTERQICLARKEIIWGKQGTSRWYLEEEREQRQRRLQWKQGRWRRIQGSAVKTAAWKWDQNLLISLLFWLLLSQNNLVSPCPTVCHAGWGTVWAFTLCALLLPSLWHRGHANSQGWGVGLDNKGLGKEQTLSSLIKLLLSAVNNYYK